MKDLKVLVGAIFVVLSTLSRAEVLPRAQTTSAKKVVSFADVFSGNFSVKRTSLQWATQGDDGTYVDSDDSGSLHLANIVTGNSTVFVSVSDLPEAVKGYYDYSIQPSGENVLFIANRTKQYRHSYFADYYVYNIKDKSTIPLVDGQAGDIQYAGWSTQNDTIAYVRGNDLYIWQNGSASKITNNGGPDFFNAVPDWVYEEEVFGDRYTLWWSPDGQQLAFLSFNETGVDTYSIPYYMGYPGQATANPYPTFLDIRYPKVGTTNPTVAFNLLDLADREAGPKKIEYEAFGQDDTIIGEVAWVTDNSSHVIFRAFNRVQDQEKLLLVDTSDSSVTVVRERDGRPGWIDNNIAIKFIPGTGNYVDLSDESGWSHLYLYGIFGSKPKAITSGDWEVTSVLNIDTNNRTIYYQSTERDSTERHIYSISFDGSNKKVLVDDTQPGVWTASFSAGGSYYIQSYNGPNLPFQRLYSVNDSSKPIQTINDNAVLASKLSAYILPNVTWSSINHPEGYSFNVMERLPPNFDSSKRYPVVFDIYGGPGSQQTSKTFRQVDFRAYLASDPELEYIVLSVDNRGTGYKGRDFRIAVASQLGKLEAQDQVYAAREWAKKPYVDATKIAIMGWSYGGYLSSKVLETDSDAFSFALITAPVSDWRFYDSIYTERYMKVPDTNLAGYTESAVHKVSGFKNVRGGFLIQHGTGDDNVHFQNGAVLVDTLTAGQVSPGKMHVQWFTDSDHSINFHSATQFVYKQMAQYLYGEKIRSEAKLVHQFDKRSRDTA